MLHFPLQDLIIGKKALQKDSGLIKHALSQSHIIATENYLSCKQQEKKQIQVLLKS